MAFKPNFDFIEELEWRGLLHDQIPGSQDLLSKEMVSGYIGFDPTADSLHIGNMVPIMLLTLFQKAGHKPVVLIGGATGRVGDPSGKSAERQLLDNKAIQKNLDGQKAQLMRFLNFDSGENKAVVVNNYDWFKDWSFLDFIRDVGKHITVSYMMSKDSVKNRLEAGGLSFTEFTYQLVQGYDFLHLYQNENCKLQMGGSDQWGNITTGTELIRRKAQGEAFAITAPLVTKADGSKFGKSEGGNIWLDPNKTPVFTFYQFWLNIGDEDAVKFIKIYSLKSREEIQALIDEHQGQEYLRILQKALAEEMTERVHSSQALELAQKATTVFFGNGKEEDLRALDEATLAASLEGMNTFQVSRTLVDKGIPVMDLIATESTIFPSKGEARKMINGNGFSLNKTKCTDPELTVTSEYVLHNRYIIAQKGKKNYFVIELN
ncbi:tyrosine--tRNA ligase [Bacteroidia bacterium]|nr:tyrosine--tRNA ligase [Bacteroidia bacterium]MDA9213596.1 tyrosine--tRNA ligase [Bacteroidia bacterium]